MVIKKIGRKWGLSFARGEEMLIVAIVRADLQCQIVRRRGGTKKWFKKGCIKAINGVSGDTKLVRLHMRDVDSVEIDVLHATFVINHWQCPIDHKRFKSDPARRGPILFSVFIGQGQEGCESIWSERPAKCPLGGGTSCGL